MNNPKLLEAIAELEAQRRIIDDAILHLRKAADTLGGSSPITSVRSVDQMVARGTQSGGSYVDEAVSALESAGGPLHVNKIVDFIASIRGEKPARASVESSLIRHIAKTKNRRIIKVGRSTYDLTERHHPTLTQRAS